MADLNSIQGFFFDTTNTITCDVDDATLTAALNECSSYELLLSRFIEGSDVWRINHSKGERIEINNSTLQLLQCAEEVRQASNGAFNIAIGSIAQLWDFSGGTAAVPKQDELRRAQHIMEQACITFEGNMVSVPPGTSIDLGGIAKGYICDHIADFLREAGASCGVLNFGGNVSTIGMHPEGRPWQVGLQTPTAERDTSVFAVVESSNNAVVTSGIYERAFVLDGKIFHHILDPRTCHPATSSVVSATVVAKDGMLADALATALLILGEEQGFALVQDFGVEAATLNNKGQLRHTENLPIKVLPGNTFIAI